MLLSRPVLESVDFILPQHLSTVRATFHDADFSHVGFSPKIFDCKNENAPRTPSSLSRLLLRDTTSEEAQVQYANADAPEPGFLAMPYLMTIAAI